MRLGGFCVDPAPAIEGACGVRGDPLRERALLPRLEGGAEMTPDAWMLLLVLAGVGAAVVVRRRRDNSMGRVSESWMRRMKHERQDEGQ